MWQLITLLLGLVIEGVKYWASTRTPGAIKEARLEALRASIMHWEEQKSYGVVKGDADWVMFSNHMLRLCWDESDRIAGRQPGILPTKK